MRRQVVSETMFLSEELVTNAVLKALEISGNLYSGGANNNMKKVISLKDCLEMHSHKITQGSDGRWRTRVKMPDGSLRLLAKKSREDLTMALFEFYNGIGGPGHPSKVTVSSLYSDWCEYKELHAASSTYMTRIRSDWRNYYENTPIINKPIAELTVMDMDVWAHELIRTVNRKKKQYYNISMIMRDILDYAVTLNHIRINPLSQVKIDSRQVFIPERKKPSQTQVFSRDEYDDFIEFAWNDFYTDHNAVHKLAPLAVLFQFQTGVRIGELLALRYEDIVGNEILVQRMYRYSNHEIVDFTKGNNPGRYVVLTPDALNLIDTAREYQRANGYPDDGYIFSINDEPLSYYATRNEYMRFCESEGIVQKSSHKARKTYISSLIDGKININTIRELVGHANEKTTYEAYCYDRSAKQTISLQIAEALSN